MNHSSAPRFGLLLIVLLAFGMTTVSCNRQATKAVNSILKKDLKLHGQVANPRPSKPIPTFDGLKKMVESNKQVNILMLPAARTKHWHHFNSLISRLSDSLGFQLDKVEHTFSSEESGDAINIGRGEIITWKFHKNDEPDSHLNFYFANWTKVNVPTKELLYRFDLTPNPGATPLDNTFLAKKLKKEYMLNMITDLALYRQKDYHHAMLQTVFKAMKMIQEADSARNMPNSPMASITASMGCHLLMNAFQAMIFDGIALRKFLDKHILNYAGNSPTEMLQHFRLKIDQYEATDVSASLHSIYELNAIYDTLQMAIEEDTRLNVDSIKSMAKAQKARIKKNRLLGLDMGNKLKQVFFLNNHLIFNKVLDYTAEDYLAERSLDNLVKKDLIDLMTDREVKLVSFYDPNDIVGFFLPRDSINEIFKDKSDPTPFIDIPVTNSTEWSVASKPLMGILSLLDDGSSPASPMRVLERDDFINVSAGYDAPSVLSKSNPEILKYLIHGNRLRVVSSRQPSSSRTLPPDNANVSGSRELKKLDLLKWKPKKTKPWRTTKRLKNLGHLAVKLGSNIRPVNLPYLYPPQGIQLDGIKECLKEHDEVYVLTIHGMQDKKPTHFDYMANELATQLGFLRGYSSLEIKGPKDLPFGIRKLTFNNSEGKSLIFEIIHWSPITKKVKNGLRTLSNQGFDDFASSQGKVFFAHRSLKEILVTDSFVDVFLALGDGDFTQLMGRAVCLAFQEIYRQDSSDARNVFFISGSLGSRILYDHICREIQDTQVKKVRDFSADYPNPTPEQCRNFFVQHPDMLPYGLDPETGNLSSYKEKYEKWQSRAADRKIARQIIKKTGTWFMMTNQIAMVGLKELHKEQRQQTFPKQIWHGIEANDTVKQSPPFDIDMRVFAFGDPNDVLTFQLPEVPVNVGEGHQFIVKNIPIRTGGGIELDVLPLYKLAKRVDKKMYKILQKSYQESSKRVKPQLLEKANIKRVREVKGQVRKDLKGSIKDRKKKLKEDFDYIVSRRIKELEVEKKFLSLMQGKMSTADTAYIKVTKYQEYLDEKLDLYKIWKNDKTVLLMPNVVNLFDQKMVDKEVSQKYMLRFDKAHDQVSKNGRVLNIIANGMEP